MQVLTFVAALLMVLSLLTYARLEMMRDISALRRLFIQNIEQEGPAIFAKAAIWHYNQIRVSSQTQKKREGSKSTPQISLVSLLNREEQVKNSQKTQAVEMLFKQLLYVLYGQQPFYREMLQERPGAIEELLERLTEGYTKLPKKKRPQQAKDLANLDVNDGQLQFFLYRLFSGIPAAPGAEKEQEVVPSLLGYITLKPNVPLRLYLAPRPILIAVLGSDSAADALIAERQQIYKGLRRKGVHGLSLEEGSKQFENTAKGLGIRYLEGDQIDFSVSKTDPSSYTLQQIKSTKDDPN